jgi:hypothetical protein
VLGLLLSSCLDENESPKIEITENAKIAKIKNWFEENESNLRLTKSGANYRTDAQELILPFFKKEPDWDKFHQYSFPDGREVYEINLENEEMFLPTVEGDSSNEGLAQRAIQNILFVKHPTENRFDPLIVRYYPDAETSKRNFESINYQMIDAEWTGIVDLFTYDEHYFMGFEIVQGQIIATRYAEVIPDGSKNRQGTENLLYRCQHVTTDWYQISSVGGREISRVWLNSTSSYSCSMSGPSSGAGGGGNYSYGGGGSSGSGSGVAYDPPSVYAPKIIIINLLTNKCADDIFKNLSKGSKSLTNLNGLGSLDISASILRLFENCGKFDYQITNEDLVGKNAETGLNDNLITVKLDNNYVQNATSLSIARTIIHETVHAYLLNTIYNDREFRANSSIFPLLQEYHAKYEDDDANNYQHATMSHYLLAMAVSLYNWDRQFGSTQGTLGFDYYYKMAFGGLVDQNNPNNLIQEAKQYIPAGSSWSDIKKILSDEAKGTNQAKGKKCK